MIFQRFSCILALSFVIIFITTVKSFPNIKDTVDPLIVGGTPANQNEFPFMVSLRIRNAGHTCGGTIYNTKTIITAAHCVNGYKTSPGVFEVMAGAHNIALSNENERQIKKVKSIKVHPNYNYNTYDSDIAILILESALKFNNWVKELKIPSQNQETTGNLMTSGWGHRVENGSLSSILQKVTVPIVSQSICSASYGNIEITNNMICAGTGGKDACQGDSGGPAFTTFTSGDNYIAGITSFGYGCARPGFPGVYTKVSKYSKWIVDNGAGSISYSFTLLILIGLLVTFLNN